jgi:RNA polymerase sigma factor (TIGR02999 family)
MRQVLVNAARSRLAQKRGGGQVKITLDESSHAPTVEPEYFLTLHDALERLEQINQRQARVIECRFFGGLSIEETAVALGVSDRTVKRDWRFARAWLGMELSSSDPS